MTDSTPVSIDDVRTLVAERHRFDEWLTALESRRSDTPEHVYARVFGDYVARRDEVMTQLHAHVPGLEQLLGELDARSTDLGLRCRAEEDERAEAMLRHAVGEYDDGKWEEVRNRVESTLATLGDEREALDAEREDVSSLLSSARPEAAVVLPPEDASVTENAVEPASPDDQPTRRDTPDWLGTITPASVPSLTPEPTSEKPTSESAPPRDDALGEVGGLEFTTEEESADRSSADVFGDARMSSRESDARSDARSDSRSDSRSDAGSGAPSSSSNAFDELAFLRSVIDPQASNPPARSTPSTPTGNSVAQKTLRCTECGTMNLPTEWYCERCGGELAAF